jgi:hypothetical protein
MTFDKRLEPEVSLQMVSFANSGETHPRSVAAFFVTLCRGVKRSTANSASMNINSGNLGRDKRG